MKRLPARLAGILSIVFLLVEAPAADLPDPVVFVSRAIPSNGTVYWSEPMSLPGAGPYSRFQVARPGKLMVLETNKSIRVLVDGSRPGPDNLRLIDVSAPEVSYDGTEIVFAGLVDGSYADTPLNDPGAWRIFRIRSDGSGLRQVTFTANDTDFSQFGELAGEFADHDDTDPCWLPDGRIIFSSTRWPGKAMYGGVRTTQLFVVHPDGSRLHRITSEHNGADRPQVDPLTGRIVYSRWWRNFRVPSDSMRSVAGTRAGGFREHLGLLSALDVGDPALGPVSGGYDNLKRNAWHMGSIRPDGTELRQFAGSSVLFYDGEDVSHAYGGAFGTDGSFFANYFPMKNMTEASGFGGIRLYPRGAAGYKPVIGRTREDIPNYASLDPVSYGVFPGPYACDPVVLSDGRLVISWAEGVDQDYGLYACRTDGSQLERVYDVQGTTEIRARVVAPRKLPPVLEDRVSRIAPAVPPLAAGPYDTAGTFSFECLNVYFNAPVDSEIISAMPLDQAGTIRFFIDHQRHQPGSDERVDWPILLREVPVAADGSIRPTELPADVPLFEQIRTSTNDGYRVPLTHPQGQGLRGAAHVGGHNFGRPGERVQCVGCHAGHSMIPVPLRREDALFSNLAPGARLSSSSPGREDLRLLVDRRHFSIHPREFWSGPVGVTGNQWIRLVFPRPVDVRKIRLWGVRRGGSSESSLQVDAAAVLLHLEEEGTEEVDRKNVGVISESGTDVDFPDVRARSVSVRFERVSGTFGGLTMVGLGEIEVIARVSSAMVPTSPRIVEVIPGNPDRVVVETAAGQVHLLQFTHRLDAMPWQVLTEFTGDGKGRNLVGMSNRLGGFYRLRSTESPRLP